MKKEILRKEYLEIRRNINKIEKEQFDELIYSKIINLSKFRKSKLVLTYVSLDDEVDTLKIIKYCFLENKEIAVPKCENGIIKFYKIKSLEELNEGKYNILEPITNNLVTNFENSICIVPGIAFDKKNNRLGYGKGYYDKFFKEYNGYKIGFAYKQCICDNICVNQFDIKMDIVITN